MGSFFYLLLPNKSFKLIQASKENSIIKSELHLRNKHRSQYDFKQLIKSCPELSKFVSVNKYNNESINFADPKAVKILNKALLKLFYGIENWDIPKNYLCPPIPGRADYIHYMADLLSSCNHKIIPKKITILDIGIGANCVYPIIGNKEYGWHFVGSDIDKVAIHSAEKIIESNNLTNAIECRLQKSATSIFENIIQPNEVFDLTICNPPFHSSFEEANSGTQRKLKNLSVNKNSKTILNFGGQNAELFCEGGEKSFIQNMIEESAKIAEACFWFSTLISKKSNLAGVYQSLKNAKAIDVKTIEMAQGNKVSRVVAWTFLNKIQQKEWAKKSWSLKLK